MDTRRCANCGGELHPAVQNLAAGGHPTSWPFRCDPCATVYWLGITWASPPP